MVIDRRSRRKDKDIVFVFLDIMVVRIVWLVASSVAPTDDMGWGSRALPPADDFGGNGDG